MDYNTLLENLDIDCLLVNSTNEYLTEYSSLEENARYTLTGFSGSTGDALITKRGIYLFVDGRYHTQADMEAKEGVNVVKLQLGQKQDDEICKLIKPDEVLGIVSKKVSQSRYEKFQARVKTRLLISDPVNNYTCHHTEEPVDCGYEPREFTPVRPTFITNLEEVSYLTGLRDFSEDGSAKIWGKLFINGENQILFKESSDEFLKSFDKELIVDKNSINAYDYSLIKNPVHKVFDGLSCARRRVPEIHEVHGPQAGAAFRRGGAVRRDALFPFREHRPDVHDSLERGRARVNRAFPYRDARVEVPAHREAGLRVFCRFRVRDRRHIHDIFQRGGGA